MSSGGGFLVSLFLLSPQEKETLVSHASGEQLRVCPPVSGLPKLILTFCINSTLAKAHQRKSVLP